MGQCLIIMKGGLSTRRRDDLAEKRVGGTTGKMSTERNVSSDMCIRASGLERDRAAGM